MRRRLSAIGYFAGHRSARATARFLKDEGYKTHCADADAHEAAQEAGGEYGLCLTEHRHGYEDEDRDGLQTFDLGDKETWAKAVWRVPAWARSFVVWDYCLSTGGPEDGFLIVADTRGKVLAGYYYEADWGTFDRRKLTKAQAQLVADFLMIEERASW